MTETVTITPGSTHLGLFEQVYRGLSVVRVDRAAQPAVAAANRIINVAANGAEPIYGVNTGFGKLASVRISAADTANLQINLLRSHSAGVGPALPSAVVRLILCLKLVSLGRGASGVHWRVIEMLESMLANDVIPYVPAQGSVGASGDLAPLAHLASALIGEGRCYYREQWFPANEALKRAGLQPIGLGAKEGLALINGTQVSTALALAALFDAWQCAQVAIVTAALSVDAMMGSGQPFRPEIHELRGHPGQIDVASAIRRMLTGSAIRESHRSNDQRVQDPYCLRCQPQVLGACIDSMRYVANVLAIEANAATDNPLVINATEDVLSGGNFHAEPVALGADQLALAIAEIGAIAQRRIALMVDPALSFGLPPFLIAEPGLNSGFMIAEVTSAALMSENKQMAGPCSVDSTPTSANQEDHVSMACHAARRLGPMIENLTRILGIEYLCAAQAIDLRAPLQTSPPLRTAIEILRAKVSHLDEDRALSDDIEKAANIIRGGALVQHCDCALPLQA